MHGRALSNARAFMRNYVERVPHYSWNILYGEEGSDPRYLAKNDRLCCGLFRGGMGGLGSLLASRLLKPTTPESQIADILIEQFALAWL